MGGDCATYLVTHATHACRKTKTKKQQHSLSGIHVVRSLSISLNFIIEDRVPSIQFLGLWRAPKSIDAGHV